MGPFPFRISVYEHFMGNDDSELYYSKEWTQYVVTIEASEEDRMGIMNAYSMDMSGEIISVAGIEFDLHEFHTASDEGLQAYFNIGSAEG